LKPPMTAEIARHFLPLESPQTERVLEYCRSGLIEKHQSLEAPLDSYFERPRLWRLSIYDHLGSCTNFYYQVHGANLRAASDNEGALAWSTEIPIAKLYAALEMGESLTSMYLRINDLVFDSQIEKEIQSVDIVDDPLIRCLFNGEFGAYQKAQLQRLKTKNH